MSTDLGEYREELEAVAKEPHQLAWLGEVDPDTLSDAPEPLFGEVAYTPPEALAAWLKTAGAFELGWFSDDLGRCVEIRLCDAEWIGVTGEILYLPEDVEGSAGPMTCNHLVPFASVGDEAAFCFDVSVPSYPVYYHQQDEPRARLIASGEWDPDTIAEPDFENFTAWLSWLIKAMKAGADPMSLGSPPSYTLDLFNATK